MLLRSRLAIAGCGAGAALVIAGCAAGAAPVRPPRRSSGGLAYSRASNQVVQVQLPPGSCHARGSGLYARPDPRCTPGALNPAVTQADIGRTICVEGWAETARPAEAITEREKARSMAAYGDRGPMEHYEYDHLVPLELGGATNDPRNLWPEPGASPNPKDTVEDKLREEVCDGAISLRRAQREIANNWTALLGSPSPARPQARPGTATQRRRARLRASEQVEDPHTGHTPGSRSTGRPLASCMA